MLDQLVGNLTPGTVRELVKQLAEIKERVTTNTALLHEIIRRQKHSDNVKHGTKPDAVQLPLTTYDAVLELEQQLKGQKLFDQMVFNHGIGDHLFQISFLICLFCHKHQMACFTVGLLFGI